MNSCLEGVFCRKTLSTQVRGRGAKGHNWGWDKNAGRRRSPSVQHKDIHSDRSAPLSSARRSSPASVSHQKLGPCLLVIGSIRPEQFEIVTNYYYYYYYFLNINCKTPRWRGIQNDCFSFKSSRLEPIVASLFVVRPWLKTPATVQLWILSLARFTSFFFLNYFFLLLR